jgi:hypothetical protein
MPNIGLKKKMKKTKKIDVFSLLKKAKPMPFSTLGTLKVDITKKRSKNEKSNNDIRFYRTN